MDAKKHPPRLYRNPATHERRLARRVESGDGANGFEFGGFVR